MHWLLVCIQGIYCYIKQSVDPACIAQRGWFRDCRYMGVLHMTPHMFCWNNRCEMCVAVDISCVNQ
jgi:hypothetical protein